VTADVAERKMGLMGHVDVVGGRCGGVVERIGRTWTRHHRVILVRAGNPTSGITVPTAATVQRLTVSPHVPGDRR